jgi:TRAP-type C4-dicarboxylate transport system substrate-binding protein
MGGARIGKMAQTIIRMGGYQGARSVHTRAGRILAREFLERVGDGHRFEFCEDVTILGRPSTDLFGMVAGGELDLCYFASSYLAHDVPDLAVFDLPFWITSREEIYPKLYGGLGSCLANAIARDTVSVSLGFWDNRFRHLSNRVRPIRRPGDCRGLSIRTMNSAVHRATFRALGFAPRFIDVKDFAEAVRTGAVDAQENPLTNMVNFKVHETHRYLTMTGHFYGVTLVLGNRARIASWPKRARDALHEAVAVATEAQRRLAAEEDVARLADLAAAGVQVTGTDEFDRTAFVEATAEVVATQSTAIDPKVMRIVGG